MDLPVNHFKRAIASGKQQIGLWCCMPDAYTAEVVAGAGFDWLVLDTEHSPADPISVLAQLQALAPYPVSAVVRPASNDIVLIKRVLDVGATTVLVPYVQNAEEARAAVTAMHYPPRGLRGVAGITRASRYGRVPDYATQAETELCLLVQAETREAIDRLESIASVDGVDGVFIGPADLAASLGYPGQPEHPEVVAVIEKAIKTLQKVGKPAGILTLDKAFARRCMELGTVFTAVGLDIALLARGSEQLAKEFSQKPAATAAAASAKA